MPKFQPGQSGNPSGRPHSHLNKLLSQYLRRKDGDKSRERKLIEKIYTLAMSGDMRAIALIWERMEGKALQHDEEDLNTFTPITFVRYDPSKHAAPGKN